MAPLIGIPCAYDRQHNPPLLGINAAYVWAVERAKGMPMLIPLLEGEALLTERWPRLDGLLLAGGGDVAPHFYGDESRFDLVEVDERRDAAEIWLAKRALASALPTLGICRGIQIINVAAGGTLYQDIASEVPDALNHRYYPDYPRDYLAHRVEIKPDSRLADALGLHSPSQTKSIAPTLQVNSTHHQALRQVPENLIVSARAPDGIVEGIEDPHLPFFIGVQWHPEELTQCEEMIRLFQAFVAAADQVRHSKYRVDEE